MEDEVLPCLGRIESVLEAHSQHLAEIENRLDTQETTLQSHSKTLDRLVERVDTLFMIVEAMVKTLNGLDNDVTAIKNHLAPQDRQR